MASGLNPPFLGSTSHLFTTSGTSASHTIAYSGESAVVTNISSANLYIYIDNLGNALTAGQGYLVLPNAQRVITVPKGCTQCTFILDQTATGSVYVELGSYSAH